MADFAASLDLPGRVNDDGITPLAFYAWIIRTLGIPDKFRLADNGEWIADPPFTKPGPETLAMLEENGV